MKDVKPGEVRRAFSVRTSRTSFSARWSSDSDFDCSGGWDGVLILPVMIHLLDVSVGFLGDGHSHSAHMSPSLQPVMGPMLSGFAVLVALISTGCACGRFGTLAQRRTITSNAEVIDVYGVGALLRLRGVDGGFTFGWRHATYIYPRLKEDGAGEGMRWTLGCLSRRRAEPFFLAVRSVGAAITKYPAVLQGHVGFRTDAFTFAACSGESRVVKFFYRPGAPGKTTLSMNPLPKRSLP